jgi:hypothetical protein
MTTSPLFSARIASLIAMRPRLQWLLVHQRTVLDHNTLWPDARTGQFARLVDGVVSPVVRGGRPLQAVCFQFAAEHYLIVIHRGICLCVVLADVGEVLDEIASVALSVLEECEDDIRQSSGIRPEAEPAPATPAAAPEPEPSPEPEPEPEPDHEPAWNAFRAHLIEVIGKILSRPQAERLIDRELKALAIDGVPKPAEFDRIGRDVVAHIPHRTKQAALLAEVLHFLES